jgi:hypothetical protein
MMKKRSGWKRRIRRPAGTLLVLAAAAALIVSAVAGPSLAAKPDGSKAKVRPFVCKGEVTATNVAANSLTVKVVKGKKAVIGKEITFTLAGKAVIMRVGDDGADVISLGAVARGDRVLVHGKVDRTNPDAPVHTAWLILDRGPAPLK